MIKRIAVIDLDGCLCAANSFRLWMLFAYLFSFFSFRWLVFVKLNVCMFLRVYGKLNRVQMKRKILEVTEDAPDYFVRWFVFLLNRYTNARVVSLINEYKQLEMHVVLCTAAPACYVCEYAKRFDFAQVFATPSVSIDGWAENFGKEKLAAIQGFFSNEYVLESVVTDHHDDLPLLLKAKKRILVNPSSDTLEVIAGQFEYEEI